MTCTTDCMDGRADSRLAVWPSPTGVVLAEIETAVLAHLVPPLNLDKVATPWRSVVRAARQRLAGQARAWRPVAAAGLDGPTGEVTSAEARPRGAFAGRVVGIDGAGKFGWVGVVADADGFHGARLGTLREIIDWAEPVDVIGIDIPIGHGTGGVRRADVAARGFVGPRGSSVFAAPPAVVLDTGSYAEANEILTAMALPMLSRQAWALVPKIVETGSVADNDARFFEVTSGGFVLRAGRPEPCVVQEVLERHPSPPSPPRRGRRSCCRKSSPSRRSRRRRHHRRGRLSVVRSAHCERVGPQSPDRPEEANGRRVAIWY